MKKLALKLVIAAVVFSVTTIRGGQAEEALERMRSAWKSTNTYEVTMVIHQEQGSKTEDRTVRLSYKRPGWVRTDILEGKDKGGIAVYNPQDNKVHAKQQGIPVVTLSPDAKLTRSLRGERIYEGSFAALLKKADSYLVNGKLRYISDAVVDGADCVVIEFETSSPDENHGIARERWWLDKKTGFPRKTNGFDSEGNKVSWVILKELKLNPQLSSDHFNL